MHDRTRHDSFGVQALLPVLFALLMLPAALAFGQRTTEDLKLLAGDGATGYKFGSSVAVGDGVVAVGSMQDGTSAVEAGSAYVLDSSTGEQIVKLLPSDGEAYDQFGFSIAIGGGVVAVAVGAIYDNDYSQQAGSVYLFDGATGEQLFKLLPSLSNSYAHFGHSVAIDGGVVAIGAPQDNEVVSGGAVYLFDVSTGVLLYKLVSNDPAPNRYFGQSVAIDNGVVVAGAPYDDDYGHWAGAVYLFDANTGTQTFKLHARDGGPEDHFGWSVAIDSGVVAVGAAYDYVVAAGSGSAYLFDASTGAQTAKLLPHDGAFNDFYGNSIAIDSGIVIVGTYFHDDLGQDSGAVYTHDATTGRQMSKLLPSDGDEGDWFGWSLAAGHGELVIGAEHDEDSGILSGSAYVFAFPVPYCATDMNFDGFSDTGDISAFVEFFFTRDALADMNGDGFVDFGDISEYVTLFLAGC